MSDRPAIVSIWDYLNDMKEGEEFEATTLDGVHYHFMKWHGRLWHRIWDDHVGQYTWVDYEGRS